MTAEKPTPRIIIHGGAGNVKRSNLTPEAYEIYKTALLDILQESHALLMKPGATALDTATHAVHLLENNPLFNAGHGAVYTTAGTHELEASVMVSKGLRKRGVGVMLVNQVKNPILLAREMLIRGEETHGGGAAGHCQLAGETVHHLARKWGLDMVEPSYYWTKRRWDEHRKGLGKSTDDQTYRREKRAADSKTDHCDLADLVIDSAPNDPSWDGHEYLPQGTVGCVVMDSEGTLCAATSTGGLTNKLPGRIGDTPTLGAGFFAEEWTENADCVSYQQPTMTYQKPHLPPILSILNGDLNPVSALRDCLPVLSSFAPASSATCTVDEKQLLETGLRPRGIAISGTGNGDSFLRTNAARTASAMVRFGHPSMSLNDALARVAGSGGMLQDSAGDRWGKTGEGEGGMIGIELVNGVGKLSWDMNCGGMFRAYVDDDGRHKMAAFSDE